MSADPGRLILVRLWDDDERPQLTLVGFYVLDGLADAPVELWPVSA